MRRLILLLLGIIVIGASGCLPYRHDTTLYESSGRQKAIVTVLPVLDRTQTSELVWDLSREFTEEIRKRVYSSPKVYLLRQEGTLDLSEKYAVADLNTLPVEMTKDLGATEFVVVAELIDQSLTPNVNPTPFPHEGSSSLSVSMRVRVVDVRHDIPRVVLQEILTQSLPISQPYLNTDYSKTKWGTESFQRSPMGLVHNRLMGEMVARMESYIEAAR
ncbi:MAG: CT253 family lipoprotein [Chlamydiales bacterium]